MSLDCTTYLGSYNFSYCEATNTLYPPSCQDSAGEYLDGYSCYNYTGLDEKATGMLGAQNVISYGDTAWMLVSTALVMIMTPGLGLFYAGLAGRSSATNTILMSFVSMALVSFQWFLVGYSFAFAPASEMFGSFQWACLLGIGANPSYLYAATIPHILFVAFQCMFAQITPAIISGAVVGRMKFGSYVLFILLWTTLIYDSLAHWVWSYQFDNGDYTAVAVANGWLGKLGAVDFAGGEVIHISSGFSALAAALVVGKRKSGEKATPHNIPMVIIGTALLWFGWFGFNAGSAASAGKLASVAFYNTQIAAATAACSWMLVEKATGHAPSAVGAASGAVAGLVAITPACGFVMTWAAFFIGLFVSPCCYGMIKLKEKLGYDDTLDAFAIHGMGGVVGSLMTGLFATKQVNFALGGFYGGEKLFAYQLAAVCTCAAWAFFGTGVILVVLDKTIGLRVSEEAESEGLDKSEHGGKAYVEAS